MRGLQLWSGWITEHAGPPEILGKWSGVKWPLSSWQYLLKCQWRVLAVLRVPLLFCLRRPPVLLVPLSLACGPCGCHSFDTCWSFGFGGPLVPLCLTRCVVICCGVKIWFWMCSYPRPEPRAPVRSLPEASVSRAPRAVCWVSRKVSGNGVTSPSACFVESVCPVQWGPMSVRAP